MSFQRFYWLFLALFLLLAPGAGLAQSNPQFFPLDEVRPGLMGVGRTILQGDKIQEFQVELIGVLKNVLAPKHDAILARLSGPAIDRTGVVAGMSGSPVYVDGKLLGAVAISFPFSKEPYTLITPIEDMLQVVPKSPPDDSSQAAFSLPWHDAAAPSPAGVIDRWIPDAQSGPALWASLLSRWTNSSSLSQFRLPAHFSGFGESVMSAYSPLLNELGFEPVEAATVSGGPSTSSPSPADIRSIVPGSMISVALVRGDLNLNVDCTVTYRQGDHIYACGHQIFSVGPADVPFAESHVLATIPSLVTSFKVDAPGPVIGSIRQDRFGAIYGVLGEQAPTIPVHIELASSLGRTIDYDFQVAQQPLLSPLLVNLAIVSAVSSSERNAGPSTLDLNGQIKLSDGEAIQLEDVVSSPLSSAGGAGSSVAVPLSYLLNGQFPNLRILGVDLHIAAQNESRVATLEQVWSTRSEVRPGDHIEVTAMERTPSGKSIMQKIPVDIPASITDKTLSLVVGSGAALNALQLRFIRPGAPPRSLRQLVHDLNRTRRNNRLYALLMTPQRSFVMEGTEYPSPPPSLLQTFMADPAVSSRVVYRTGSIVGDYATKAVPYAIEGEQTLYLKVISPSN